MTRNTLDYVSSDPGASRRPILRLAAVLCVASGIFLLCAGPFINVRGYRLLGYQYGAWVNNSQTICPDTLASLNGTTVALADGRVFETGQRVADALQYEFLSGENRVFIDPGDHCIYIRYQIGHCSFDDPSHCQLITIPLLKRELHSHGRRPIGEVAIRGGQ